MSAIAVVIEAIRRRQRPASDLLMGGVGASQARADPSAEALASRGIPGSTRARRRRATSRSVPARAFAARCARAVPASGVRAEQSRALIADESARNPLHLVFARDMAAIARPAISPPRARAAA